MLLLKSDTNLKTPIGRSTSNSWFFFMFSIQDNSNTTQVLALTLIFVW